VTALLQTRSWFDKITSHMGCRDEVLQSAALETTLRSLPVTVACVPTFFFPDFVGRESGGGRVLCTGKPHTARTSFHQISPTNGLQTFIYLHKHESRYAAKQTVGHRGVDGGGGGGGGYF
jgi:hypothetical protein